LFLTEIEGQVIANLEYHEVYSAESSTNDLEVGEHSKGGHNEDMVLKTLFQDGGESINLLDMRCD
jgi:hypothetical protein